MMKMRTQGFTIVELLIVIVIIGILAAITIIAYNGVQDRARTAARDNDVATYGKAIRLARINTGKILRDITGSGWSAGSCAASSGNPSDIEPKDLPKSHSCWTRYYDNLDKIGAAAGMSLDGLKKGDPNGNPYILDENEGENCSEDKMYAFRHDGTAAWNTVLSIPRTAEC